MQTVKCKYSGSSQYVERASYGIRKYNTGIGDTYTAAKQYSNNVLITIDTKPNDLVLLEGDTEKAIVIANELIQIKEAVEQSRYILNLEDDWDDHNAKAPSKEVYQKTIQLLIEYANEVFNKHRIVIKAPEINPGRNGSIDLDWRCEQAALLINIASSDGIVGSYYGDNDENNFIIEGFLNNGELNEDLAYWMRKLN